MDANQPAANDSNTVTVSFSPKKLTPVPFLLGVLLFFAPFIDIRCNDVSLQRVSGVNLATGFEIKNNDSNSLLGNFKIKDDDFSFEKEGKRGGNPYALAALVIGILGFIISLIKFRSKGVLGVITGIGAAATLIGLMADIKSQVKLDVSAKTHSTDISFGIEFTPWFYFAIASFLVAAFMSYKAMSGSNSVKT